MEILHTMRTVLVTFAIGLLCTACAQYNGPESVEYDPGADRYFISNTSTSRIKVRDQSGTVTDFAINIPDPPYGLEIMGGVLYACTGNGVRGYDLSTGLELYHRDLGALFPNGITTDGQFLYITDFNTNARRIYKVDPVADQHTTLVTNTGGQPNGIVWDPVGERLVTVFWGSNAPIKAYDRNTGAETLLVANTGVGNIDGVTIDCDGNFLIASWSPARITRYEPTFVQSGVDLAVPGLANPADIDFDHVNIRVCIPNSGNNTVTLFDQSCLTSGMSAVHSPSRMNVVPNPSTGRFRLEPAPEHPLLFVLYDAVGAMLLSGLYQPGQELSIGKIPVGTYTLRFPTEGRAVRMVME